MANIRWNLLIAWTLMLVFSLLVWGGVLRLAGLA
jgi:hypothetical protein